MKCVLVILSLLGQPAIEREYPTCEAARAARADMVVLWRTCEGEALPAVVVAFVEERADVAAPE